MNKNDFAKKPPMGWNSWDCYGASVREEEVRQNAEYMAKNLLSYGWNIITVDIQWSEPNADGTEYHDLAKLCMDEYGRLIPAENRFPSAKNGNGFKPLADYVHSLGLLFGIHIMRGIPREAVYQNLPIKDSEFTCRDAVIAGSVCEWNADMYGVEHEKGAGQAYLNSILDLYASWGVDFIKCDDMSWKSVRTGPHYHTHEADMYRKAIDRTGRPIIYSSSPGTFNTLDHECLIRDFNMWRISDDFWDSWESLLKQYDLLNEWNPYMGEGHFPDADMLPIGHLSVRFNNENNASRYTNLTQDEQRFMFSLWSIARSPLILGCELTDMDSFSLSLVQNKDMIDCNQNSTNNKMVLKNHELGVWTAESDHCYWIALFNLTDAKIAASYLIDSLDNGICKTEAINSWTGENVPIYKNILSYPLNAHEGCLFKIVK